MLDTKLLNDTIAELEEGPISFNLCEKLASLYIVREHLNTGVNNKNSTVVEREFNDILPQYHHYVKIKRDFQLNGLPEQVVIDSMSNVCREIKEFIQTLYSSTDLPAEREQIKDMLNSLVSFI